ncbi:S-adenosyl-L-methionine-dependent methyltransferase [Lentinula boryana]|uniref:S-adenosyl-L-methionine-dependent methyltransferase n=1 Tax=Lentinula boryana TaxID=40481 RepID=A0ABQ8QT46_9AGAR|nr:S-adenosyl-L-methionine-dependent methyltransferase [Lentinula boryana]
MASVAFAPLTPLKGALRFALIPFLCDVWTQICDRFKIKSTGIRWRLSSFIELRRTFFAHLWRAFGRDSDQHTRNYKQALLSPAQGVVLDLGAGLGRTASYLSRDKVFRYIAVEPNIHMHSELRDAAHEAGFHESDGTFVLLSCGAEDVRVISECASTVNTPTNTQGSVDSIICILTLCSIPDAERIVTQLVKEVLRPGGTLLMFEHVRHPIINVAWWQWLWSPLWSVFFDGCRLDCVTDQWVEEMRDIEESGRNIAMWKERELKSDRRDGWENNIIYHVIGTFVKHD